MKHLIRSHSIQGSVLTIGSLLALSFASLPSVAVAQQSAMQVGAYVAPKCRIDVDETTIVRGRIRVACGRSAFRVLRVSTDSGERLEPLAPLAATPQAGGELVFPVPRSRRMVASVVPVTSPPQLTQRALTVTFDF